MNPLIKGAGLPIIQALAAVALAATVHTAAAAVERSDGLPDWTGVWIRNGGDLFDGGAAKWPQRDHPPYKPAWETKYKSILATGGVKPANDASVQCLPRGTPAMMGQAGKFAFAVTPHQTWVMAEDGNQTRRIYTDGRAQLSGDDLFPTYTGNSVGHWEGDTLVATTVGLRDDMPLDRSGALLSGDAKVTERIRMIGPNLLEDRMTIEDTMAFTRPWTVVKTYRRAPAQARIWDSACHDHYGKLLAVAPKPYR